MISLRRTRQYVLTSIVAVWVLVAGGLGWATHSAIQLDREQTVAERHEAHGQRLKQAMWRLDGIVRPELSRETARPYKEYKSYYTEMRAWDEESGAEITRPILLASPLQQLTGPDWFLVHFQASEVQAIETGGWTSPQLPHDTAGAMSAVAFPTEFRDRYATAANWLAALRARYTPSELQQVLDEARAFHYRHDKLRPRDRVRSEQVGERDVPRPALDGSALVHAGELDFIRRGDQFIRMMEQSALADQCDPAEMVAGNLPPITTSPEPEPGCIEIRYTHMFPLWLDLSRDGRLQLAFVRSVSAASDPFCTLQGVLIDWPRLRGELERSVRDLVGDAEIVPVRADEDVGSEYLDTMMTSLPARLELRGVVAAAAPAVSGGLKLGLSVAWAATILALCAIGYGLWKYIGLAERRVQFAAAATHELRTPLTTFKLYTDLLADAEDGDAGRRRGYVETLRSEADRLGRLVENVLAFSRIEDRKTVFHWRRVRPGDLLAAVHEQTREQCRAGDKELVVDDRCRDATIETDSDFVVQILANLVDNACKYSAAAEDRRVWLTAVADDGGVTFEVEDAGDGVSPHDRRGIFAPFRRGESQRGGQTRGMGLGLALSRHWAECLGGTLTLRRSSRNGGQALSCFALHLPGAAVGG